MHDSIYIKYPEYVKPERTEVDLQSLWVVNKEELIINMGLKFFFFKLFLKERERELEHNQGEWQREREKRSPH